MEGDLTAAGAPLRGFWPHKGLGPSGLEKWDGVRAAWVRGALSLADGGDRASQGQRRRARDPAMRPSAHWRPS